METTKRTVGKMADSQKMSVILMISFLLIFTVGCGTKKNTVISRSWQEFTTRYNIYYNGSEHFDNTLHDMEAGYEDDYNRLLPVHPAEARGDATLPQPQGDFTRTIEKMQKAIELHSITKRPPRKTGDEREKAFRARTEFNPFLHNAWMMMGQAEYYNGDFKKAAATFRYISRNFTWLPETVTAARLWQARCYLALGLTYEAENCLRPIKEKDITDDGLTYLYDLAQGEYLLKSGNLAEAAPFLRKVAEKSSGNMKTRLWFLLGQIYSRTGNRQLAYDAFGNAEGGVSTPYRAKLNARVRRSEVYSRDGIAVELKSLKRLTRYERNREYLDKIYYAIGNLQMEMKDTTGALESYRLAIGKSSGAGLDRALSQLALGKLYFSLGEYVKAQPYYSDAAASLPEDYPGVADVRKRSDVLDELSVYAGNVNLQDSLLRLAALPLAEREKECRRMASEYVRQMREAEDEARREEAISRMDSQSQPAEAGNVTPYVRNNDNSWYFYNSMTLNAGKSEFQRKWGARKLEDNWRRRDKRSFSFDDSESLENETDGDDENATEEVAATGSGQGKADDPAEMEYYLRQIPTGKSEIKNANDIVREGLYNMALILKDKLDDYAASRKIFMELDRRYPDNIYRLDAYYNLFLMAVRENNDTDAERWREKLLADFPSSSYAKVMRNPDYFNLLRHMHEMQEGIYEKTYEAFLKDDNENVHRLTSEMEGDYPLSPILPKFIFLDALAHASDGNTEMFKNRLTDLLTKWPDTEMTDMASGMLRALQSGRSLAEGTSNARGLRRDMVKGEIIVEDDSIPVLPEFEILPDSPHYVVFVFPVDSIGANKVLYDVARFNFSRYTVRDFELEPMRYSGTGLLVVKDFRNERDAERYVAGFISSATYPTGTVCPVVISADNFTTLLKGNHTFEDYFRFVEDSEDSRTDSEHKESR